MLFEQVRYNFVNVVILHGDGNCSKVDVTQY